VQRYRELENQLRLQTERNEQLQLKLANVQMLSDVCFLNTCYVLTRCDG